MQTHVTYYISQYHKVLYLARIPRKCNTKAR